MNWLGRRRLKHAVLRSRIPFKGEVARGYLRAVERYRSLQSNDDQRPAGDGLPVPPARLRVLVAETADRDWFLNSGESHARYLRELAAEAERPLEQMDAILDFACGCGRIARWFSDLDGPRVSGCDYNRELVDWCEANLPFMDVRTNELEPPLPYPDNSFDFLYAFSVFTHLSVELAGRWMAELGRVVKPDGLVWFTLHGASYRGRLLPEEKIRFDAGEIVVWLPEIQGTNLCASYWPHPAVERMLGGEFKILAHFDPGANIALAEKLRLSHDAYLVRRC